MLEETITAPAFTGLTLDSREAIHQSKNLQPSPTPFASQVLTPPSAVMKMRKEKSGAKVVPPGKS